VKKPIQQALAALCLLCASGARAEGLDFNLSEDALRGAFAGSLTDLFPSFDGLYELGVLAGERHSADFLQGHAGLLVTGDAGARDANVTAGLGVRLAVLDVEQVSGGALALGGMLEARLPAFNRIGLVAYAYGAPEASSFGDLEGWFEYSAALDYQVLRNASLYAGYRQLKVEPQHTGDWVTVDTGWHLGLRLSF
jgi:hypothetical protein